MAAYFLNDHSISDVTTFPFLYNLIGGTDDKDSL